jgi:class 3 adenylate cyclase
MGGLPTGAVTFLLTDVPGSTGRWEAQPDETAAALVRLDEIVEAAAARFGGHVVKPRGENDSHFLVFASPAGAARAALRLAATAAAEGLVPVRMALTTGEAELVHSDYLGPVVNHCARLRAAAHAGQVVVGAPAADAMAGDLPDGVSLVDLGWHWLKDLDQPLRAFELRHPDLPSGFAPLTSMAPPARNLPLPLTSFVGREEERAAVDAALEAGAPVTITGAPGVGKSRLAIEVAGSPGRAGQTLIRFLDATDGGRLPGLDEVPVPTLVVIDDVDHRLDEVRALLAGRPRSGGPSVVFTSRTPTGAEGETVVRLSPLGPHEAERLLADRASAARPGVALAAAAPALVAALSGLPLAIELAAARLAVLAPDQLVARLTDPGRVLSSRAAFPARHRGLAEAVAWTIDRLGAEDRAGLSDLAAGRPVAEPVAASLIARGWAERTEGGAEVLAVLAAVLRSSAEMPA